MTNENESAGKWVHGLASDAPETTASPLTPERLEIVKNAHDETQESELRRDIPTEFPESDNARVVTVTQSKHATRSASPH